MFRYNAEVKTLINDGATKIGPHFQTRVPESPGAVRRTDPTIGISQNTEERSSYLPFSSPTSANNDGSYVRQFLLLQLCKLVQQYEVYSSPTGVLRPCKYSNHLTAVQLPCNSPNTLQ